MKPARPLFIDLFAGCGGLSLGLFQAGWQGVFAIERESRAFGTLAHNLLGAKRHKFAWPRWLKRQAWTLEEILEDRYLKKRLGRWQGRIDLLAGGPPCQGFSTIGRRKVTDPRNQLFRHYIQAVRLLKPKLVLIENVEGIRHAFRKQSAHLQEAHPTYAELINDELRNLGYKVWTESVLAADFGVPQMRPRFLFIAADQEYLRKDAPEELNPFELLRTIRGKFLIEKKLKLNRPVTAGEAIADLHTKGRLEPWPDDHSFKQGRYGPQRSQYQRLMHGDLNGQLADSHRLANHRPETIEKFAYFIKTFEPGKKIDPHKRGRYFTKKHSIAILHPAKPAPTVTTLPDDLLHYHEPRILTVRENARLQSFPDWFEFKGKYTTGGKERTKQCPRYTQVGNAVPPLLAEAVGKALLEFKKKALKS